jgi:hypothetical protein
LIISLRLLSFLIKFIFFFIVVIDLFFIFEINLIILLVDKIIIPVLRWGIFFWELCFKVIFKVH